MVSQVELDRTLRRIPVGTTELIYGIPVSKVVRSDGSQSGSKVYLYAINGREQPLRIGPALRVLADLLRYYDPD